jgi:hypothetical protein
LAISRYKDNGYDRHEMNKTIMALRSASSQRNGMSSSEGNNAAMTCGIVSPIIMQNASIPPNALDCQLRSAASLNNLQCPLRERNRNQSLSPKAMLYRSLK